MIKQTINSKTFEQLHKAVNELSLRCDGAAKQDGHGFNGADAQFGKQMAMLPYRNWSDKQAIAVYGMLAKYKTQLSAYGVDYEAIEKPSINTEKLVRRVEWNGKKFILKFEKSDPDFKAMLEESRELPGRYFNWETSANEVIASNELKEFAKKWKFTGNAETHKQLSEDVPATNGKNVIELAENGKLVFIFDFSWEILESVKAVPGRAWEECPGYKGKVNTMAISELAVKAAQGVAKKWHFAFTEEAEKAIVETLGKQRENLEASKAADSDFEVEGINGTPYPFQKAGASYLVNNPKCFLADEMGLGKAQPLDAKILTPSGWKLMGEIKVGDLAIGSNGKPTKITGVFPQGTKEVYKVIFSDGSSTECCQEHLWLTNSSLRKWRGYAARVFSLRELIQQGIKKPDGGRRHFIPLVQPVEFYTNDDLPLHPYLVGLLIGDGALTNTTPSITVPDLEILERLKEIVPDGIIVRHRDKYDYSLSLGPLNSGPNPLTVALRKLGLMGKYSYEKEVPGIYLWNSIENRLEMLRGLMDSDGWVQGASIQFASSSKKLSDNVAFLVQSLGGVARQSSKKTTHRDSYIVTIALPGINPFWLPRKADIANVDRPKYPPMRSIDSVELVGKKEVQCISVDADDSLYVTDDFIVTHNTIQGLMAIKAVGSTCSVIVVPASVKINWARETKKWLNIRATVLEGRKGKIKGRPQVVIVNYDILHYYVEQLRNLEPDVVICDESHRLKNHRAKRSQAADDLVNGHLKTEKGKRIAGQRKVPYVWFLTGTPVLNRPNELLHPLSIMGALGNFGGFWEFARRYIGARQGSFGLDMSGAQNLPELNQKLRAYGLFIRRTKEQVLPELPDKTWATLPVTLSNESEYRKAEKDVIGFIGEQAVKETEFIQSVKDLPDDEKQKAIARYRSSKEASAARAKQLTEINALKQLAAKGKLKEAINWIDDFLTSGEKLIVFAYHRFVTEHLAEHYGCPFIIGGMPSNKRQDAVDAFQNDLNVKLIVCNIIAAGEGLTLTAASNELFLEFPWTPAAMDQASDRAHRIGQKNNVTAWQMVGENSIDEKVVQLIETKRAVVDAVTEGDDPESQASILSELVDYLMEKRQ